MIPFNKPYLTGLELSNIQEAHANGHLSGDGPFTKKCHAWLRENTGAARALLTHSCTAALEMSAMLLNLAPGDEVIMPSFTFVSTANAFVLRGAIPVFVDIRTDTLNIDERLIEAAITPKTKAICVVHYAGVSCEMDQIMAIARRHGLAIVEDAAQGIMSKYRGKPLGTIGDLGALSFHETKNIISGEGGALLCRDDEFSERAEILREKGTNRSRFFRGQVDKYTWVDLGSSFLPGEVTAAFLAAQMERADDITAKRLSIWSTYHDWAAEHEAAGRVRRPIIPEHCDHNAHMYYLLMPSPEVRTHFIEGMKAKGIGCVFHYIPLHSSPGGIQYGRAHGVLNTTDDVSDRLVRLPLWIGIEPYMDNIIHAADSLLRS
ncbi:dTDP-4-amino-4,6-dideoxygalactose transaminase [Lysobacter sp. HDW10]|uniref:dTDP-4-amino-4,6-dideoxygalactose transaminase n=1 Tax=Lysobacter sp. HDW10 TaxID=2714936 RepID=UPI00140C2D48|nr:dTDP-4-amino-4,6-dideoxygalactose transaminase [Lysobacter sp. HDW10]QIK80424.1 dTDP-4-amino-4,6-dideoxygalactose transaminase [Lysobacter sp. HDW10]